MFRVKTTLVSLFVVLFFHTNSHAQIDSANAALSGKWALQFQIKNNFTLDNFQGSAFSGKFHFNNHSAIRVGVDLSTYSTKEEYSHEENMPDTTLFENSAQSGENNIKINIQYLYYNNINNSISMFLGVGVNHTMRPIYNREINNENQLGKTSINITGYGVDLIFGVEWFVRNNIGISAEYNSGYSYVESTRTFTLFENDEIEDEISGDNFIEKTTKSYSRSSFENNSVKLGVSIYF